MVESLEGLWDGLRLDSIASIESYSKYSPLYIRNLKIYSDFNDLVAPGCTDHKGRQAASRPA